MSESGPTTSPVSDAAMPHIITGGPVVCGVDGSRNAQRAIDVATTLATSIGVDVIAVHALGLMSTIDGEHVTSFDHRDEIEQKLRDEWCAALDSVDGLNWSCRLVDGNPSDVLLHTADETNASFIVVGARGIGGHPDLMLGSTSHQVIHRAHCATVVVPPFDRPISTVREPV